VLDTATFFLAKKIGRCFVAAVFGRTLPVIHFGRFLAAKSHFSYGALQTVNLLAYAFSGSNPLLPTSFTRAVPQPLEPIYEESCVVLMDTYGFR